MGGRCVSILLLSKRVHFGIYCRPSNFLRQCSFKTDLNLCHISTRVSFRFVACSAIVFFVIFSNPKTEHIFIIQKKSERWPQRKKSLGIKFKGYNHSTAGRNDNEFLEQINLMTDGAVVNNFHK